MMDKRVCPSVQRPSRDVQLPEPSGPRCCKLSSAASRRSGVSPRRVIAAKIPHIRCVLVAVPGDDAVIPDTPQTPESDGPVRPIEGFAGTRAQLAGNGAGGVTPERFAVS